MFVQSSNTSDAVKTSLEVYNKSIDDKDAIKIKSSKIIEDKLEISEKSKKHINKFYFILDPNVSKEILEDFKKSNTHNHKRTTTDMSQFNYEEHWNRFKEYSQKQLLQFGFYGYLIILTIQLICALIFGCCYITYQICFKRNYKFQNKQNNGFESLSNTNDSYEASTQIENISDEYRNVDSDIENKNKKMEKSSLSNFSSISESDNKPFRIDSISDAQEHIQSLLFKNKKKDTDQNIDNQSLSNSDTEENSNNSIAIEINDNNSD